MLDVVSVSDGTRLLGVRGRTRSVRDADLAVVLVDRGRGRSNAGRVAELNLVAAAGGGSSGSSGNVVVGRGRRGFSVRLLVNLDESV